MLPRSARASLAARDPSSGTKETPTNGSRKRWRQVKDQAKFETRLDRGFAAEIAAEVPDGERLRGCIQCGTCAGTCPMSPYMDFTPRRIIGMIREGDRDDVVTSITPWVCASCYSCTVECPKQIPITGIMHAIRRIALREKAYPKRFPIPVMEREFVDMVEEHGRSTESWLAVRMYMKTDPMQLVKHAWVGQRLMRRGRMGLGLDSIRDRAQLRDLLRAVEGPAPASGAQPPRAASVSASGTEGAS